MASLITTTVNNKMTVANSGLIFSTNSDITDWYQLYHCDGGATTRLHVRTPIPADIAGIGWNPIILEVHGHHSYAGEHVHDFKALVNVNGYNNDWYGSQVVSQSGYASNPYVYRSSSTYGGRQRVCFSVDKLGGCSAGWLWVRWWNGSGQWNSYAWGVGSNYANDGVF